MVNKVNENENKWLGSMRPNSIARLEKELWKYFFVLAADENVENQEMTLESFLEQGGEEEQENSGLSEDESEVTDEVREEEAQNMEKKGYRKDRQKAPNPREEESDTSSSSASQTSTKSSEPNHPKLGTSHKWKKSQPTLPLLMSHHLDVLSVNQSHADTNFLEALAEAAKPSTERHILVEGMEYDLRMEFDRRGLERVGNWDEPRTLQDLSIEPDTPKGFNGRLMTMSLKDLEWHAKSPNGRILNCLKLPNSTGCMAWSHALNMPMCKKHQQKPITNIWWELAATAGAIRYWHLDTNGFATYID
ncbi:hypothetical protein F5887DRAFT_923231 [Amanita rubescens]|nr:hypothetical protein F5887DRAFT_923231 [Amanita rubescens]